MRKSMGTFVFEVTWDNEANVWWVSKTPIPGLITEAETLDELSQKLVVMIPEMLEERIPKEGFQSFGRTEDLGGASSGLKTGELPIQINSFRNYITV